jgi:hypothetical protein
MLYAARPLWPAKRKHITTPCQMKLESMGKREDASTSNTSICARGGLWTRVTSVQLLYELNSRNRELYAYVRSEALTAAKCGYRPCQVVRNYRRFGDHLCPHHQDLMWHKIKSVDTADSPRRFYQPLAYIPVWRGIAILLYITCVPTGIQNCGSYLCLTIRASTDRVHYQWIR